MRFVHAAGRALIAAGLLVLLFVAYQLWGTGFREARSQDRLRAELEAQLVQAPAVPSAAVPTAEHTPMPTSEAPSEGPDNEGGHEVPPTVGDPVAVLRIPKLGLDKVVVEGTDRETLRLGPGHDPTTPLPGRAGNSVIAGHRTTYGAPFWDLDKLVSGDIVVVSTAAGDSRYVVAGSRVVEADDVSILEPTGDDRLTLFTCTPRFSSARRLVVTALLEPQHTAPAESRQAAPRPQTSPAEQSTPRLLPRLVPSTEGGAAHPGTRPEGAFVVVQGSVPRALAWASGTLAGVALTGVARRRYRRVIVYPVAAPVLAVAVLATFEQIADLLPAGV